MTPIGLSHGWYRRLYLALGTISLGYVILYVLQITEVALLPQKTELPLIVAIGGSITLIASIAAYFIKGKAFSFAPAFSTYIALTLITAFLVQSSGGVESPYLAIWPLIVFASPIYGAYGWLPVLALTASYFAGAYLSDGLDSETIALIAFSSVLPMATGLTLWRNSSRADELANKNVKHLASQLSEVAAKSEIVINAIGDGVIAIDGTGTVQLINPAAQEILGWGKQDALMLNYKSILKLIDESGTEVSSSLDPLQQVLNTNQQSRGHKILATTHSGKKITLSIVASPIGETGSGAIAVFRDITKESAEEREQAEFISTASHEMRTPVASIEGYLGLAMNPATATIDPRAHDFITKAHESAQHLGRLFQDLLDVSRSEDGRMQSDPEVVDIVHFAESIVQGLTPKATEKNLQLNFVPSGSGGGQKRIMPVYYIHLDNDHVREILDNLIENAIKYTPEGTVTVDINGTEDKVVISIQDSGLGIPAEDIPHLFQKFYRVSNMDRQSIGGTGLGLYLCRRLVEGMQGRIWVESTFGQGSTFFVELPRINSEEASRLKAEHEARLKQKALSEPQAQPKVSIPVQIIESAPVAQVAPQGPDYTSQTTQAPIAPQPVQAQVPAPAPATPASPPQPLSPEEIAQALTGAQAPRPPQAPPAQQMHQPPQVATQPAQAPAYAAPPAAPQPAPVASGVQPATTVPRGETLTRDQINQRVQQLEALAREQRNASPERR